MFVTRGVVACVVTSGVVETDLVALEVVLCDDVVVDNVCVVVGGGACVAVGSDVVICICEYD